MEPSAEDLTALNLLVQVGLAEVVTIEDGEVFYRLASRFKTSPEPSDRLRLADNHQSICVD
jgi:hypothetical protein